MDAVLNYNGLSMNMNDLATLARPFPVVSSFICFFPLCLISDFILLSLIVRLALSRPVLDAPLL